MKQFSDLYMCDIHTSYIHTVMMIMVMMMMVVVVIVMEEEEVG